ncbi:MAG: hypothetical protein NZM65_05835 [Flavobacteriales bacterium]|nr:hypothetical protein [Flavobacteriales bacterium]MDW8410194.1 hypothetical protein [Flavobacteriales bacterium]
MCRWLAVSYFLLGLMYSPSLAQNPDCDCPEHPGALTIKKLEGFDIIFLGYVDSVGACDIKTRRGRAFWKVLSLYKGRYVPVRLVTEYPCAGACRFDFRVGETWLLYGHKKGGTPVDPIELEPCERNRPWPKGEDAYVMYNEMTFGEETLFLRRHLLPAYVLPDTSLARKAQEGEVKVVDPNRHERYASPHQKLVLLIVSLISFLLIWWLMRRWFRNM